MMIIIHLTWLKGYHVILEHRKKLWELFVKTKFHIVPITQIFNNIV